MLNWIKSFFKKPELQVNSAGYYYVVYIKGSEYARKLSRQAAEDFIRELFEESDVSTTNGLGSRRTTKYARYNRFRSYCKIEKYCGSCGLSGVDCGQC